MKLKHWKLTLLAAALTAAAPQARGQEVNPPPPPQAEPASPSDAQSAATADEEAEADQAEAAVPQPPRIQQEAAVQRPVVAVAPPDADPGYAPAVRYPEMGNTFLDHSSTYEEGVLRGTGALARGVGAARLDTSLAAMNYQEAYRRALENSLRYAETYYAKRDLWFDYQEAHNREPLTMEGYRRIAEAEGADRLTAEQFDPETGKILWPNLLEADVLEPYRVTIEEALASRSVTDVGLGSRTYERVRLSVDSMREILERNRKSLPSHLYVNATRFLDSVQFESRFAPPGAAAPEGGQ